jgi:hypothetical protein
MKVFYEVRERLHNPNQWMKIAFFEQKKDASEFIICKAEIEGEEREKFDEPKYQVITQRFNTLEEYKFNSQPAGHTVGIEDIQRRVAQKS